MALIVEQYKEKKCFLPKLSLLKHKGKLKQAMEQIETSKLLS